MPTFVPDAPSPAFVPDAPAGPAFVPDTVDPKIARQEAAKAKLRQILSPSNILRSVKEAATGLVATPEGTQEILDDAHAAYNQAKPGSVEEKLAAVGEFAGNLVAPMTSPINLLAGGVNVAAPLAKGVPLLGTATKSLALATNTGMAAAQAKEAGEKLGEASVHPTVENIAASLGSAAMAILGGAAAAHTVLSTPAAEVFKPGATRELNAKAAETAKARADQLQKAADAQRAEAEATADAAAKANAMRAADFLKARAEELQQVLRDQQIGVGENIVLQGTPRSTEAVLNTRPGEQKAERQRLALQDQPEPDDGSIPPGTELSAQAQQVAREAGEPLPPVVVREPAPKAVAPAEPAPAPAPTPEPPPAAPLAAEPKVGPLADAPSGMVFVSPSVQDITLPEAIRRMGDETTYALAKRARDLSPDAKVQRAVGDWKDGAENALAVTLPDGATIDGATKIAARLGLEANQKNVGVVIVDEAGPDALHVAEWPAGTSIELVSKVLDESGIPNRTIVPTKDGITAYVMDQGLQLGDNIHKLADHETAPTVSSSRARVSFPGDPAFADRAAGARKYREILGEPVEEPQNPGGQAALQGDRGTGPAGPASAEVSAAEPAEAPPAAEPVKPLQEQPAAEPAAPVVKRAKDFQQTGNYDVTIKLPDGTSVTRQMFRDPENGWWYQDPLNTGKHHTENVLSVRGKAEAIEGLVAKTIKEAGAPKKRGIGEGMRDNPERGAITIDIPQIVKDAAARLESERKKLVQYWRAGDLRTSITSARDAADNTANVLAREEATTIRHEIERQFPKADRKLAETALSMTVEANGDPLALDVMRQKVQASTTASPKWKTAITSAIDFAKANNGQLEPIADLYREATDRQLAAEQTTGIVVPKRDGYVMHAQDLDDPMALPSLMGSVGTGGGGGGSTGFRHMRVHDTFADSVAAGIDPKSLNAVDLLQARVAAGAGLVNRRAWIESLKHVTDPTNGFPVASKPIIEIRPDGTPDIKAPPGYNLESIGGQPLAVQKGYEPLFRSLTQPSALNEVPIGKALNRANAAGKSFRLLLDTFHLGRVGAWSTLIKSPLVGGRIAELPNPFRERGVTLLDTSTTELQKMAANGEIPARLLPQMLADKAKLDLALRSGANFGKISDALHQEWVQAIPVLGQFNKWLFDKFQRSAMAETWLLEFERQRSMNPGMQLEQLAGQVSQDINTKFGNLGRQGIIRSRTMQDLARLAFLAPQWNEGLIRSEVGAVTGTARAARAAYHGKFQVGLLPRAVGAMTVLMFAMNQVLNYGTRGHPTWDNPEEDWGSKVSAWIPDKIGGGPGFFLNPIGLSGEITHLLSKRYAQTSDAVKAVTDLLRARASQFTQPLWVAVTGEDFLGRRVKKGDTLREMAKASIPVPIASPAAVGAAKQMLTGQHSESYAGQFQKQIMSSFGLKTDSAPNSEQRISSLAREFDRQHGVEPAVEFNTTDYQALSHAVGVNNPKDSQDAVSQLLQKKTPAEAVAHYIRAFDFPYTGSAQREFEFYRGLNEEQRHQYVAGVAHRMDISQRAIQLIDPKAPGADEVFDTQRAQLKLQGRLALYQILELPPGEQRNNALRGLLDKPELEQAVEHAFQTFSNTIPKTSEKVEALPVADGTRARFIFNEAMKLPAGQQRAEYIGHLQQTGVITTAVEDQLVQLMSR